MILTITPNPLLSYVLHLPTLPPPGANRVASLPWTVGGKGINVARMLKTLGRPGLALGFAGGPNGDKIKARLTEHGISARFIPCSSETRVGFDLIVDHPRTHHWWLEDGQTLTEREILDLLTELDRWLPQARFLALSGTLPGQTPADFYRRIIEQARPFRVEVFLDARGAPLNQAIEAGGFFLKHNRQEFMETFGNDPFHNPWDNPSFHRLRDRGIPGALITDGGGPALFWDPPRFYLLLPPPVQEVSAVGCGDAALAGFLYARACGASMLDAARWAMAAGAADAGHAAPCAATANEVESLLPLVEIRGLPTPSA